MREKRLVANSGKGEISGSNAESVSISESSGSIVNRRMFERSAPAAPGGGLEGAWLAGQPHEALLLGEEDEEGRVDGGHAWRGKGRRGHSEADQLRLLDNIVRGKYRIQRDRVGDVGVDFIQQVKNARSSLVRGSRNEKRFLRYFFSCVFPRGGAHRSVNYLNLCRRSLTDGGADGLRAVDFGW